MVFNFDYDKALWIMLQGDKINREVLIKFINSLTNDMYKCIHDLIYNDSRKSNITCLLGDNFTLYVELHDKELTIKLNQFNISKERVEEFFSLTLVPLENTDKLLKKDEKELYIGNFNYKTRQLYPVVDEFVEIREKENVNYVLKKKLFGYSLFMVSPGKNCALEQSMVDIKNIPDKIYPHYFTSESRQRRLIRRRNR
ncbi:MAG: hypothetical protein IJE89_03310 [Bacilli bacterium]|nr:hypothetical protein [Bacilli bacterium]